MKKLPSSWLFLFLIPISVGFFFHQGYYLSCNSYPADDQVDYLTQANWIKENGGVIKFPLQLITNNFTENRKHPLYSLVLSIIAEKDVSFFKNAKILEFAVSLLTITVLFIVAFKAFSLTTAVIATSIFAANKFIMEEFSLLVPDAMFPALVALSWFFIAKGFSEDKGRNFLWGMVFASIAFLSKPVGILILGSYLISSLVIYRRSLHRIKEFGLSLLVFIAVASPLLIRNFIIYKNPFYNNNTSLLWIDDRQQRRAVGFKENPPTVFDYLRSHKVRDEIINTKNGAIGLISNISLITLFEVRRLRYPVILLLLMVVGIFLDKNRRRALFSAVLFGSFYLFFSYNYKVSPHYRHIIPISFLIFFYVINALSKVLPKRVLLICVALISFLPLYVVIIEKKISPISEINVTNLEIPSEQAAFLYFAKDNFDDRTIIVKGNEERLAYEWYDSVHGVVIPHPYFATFEEFASFLKEKDVRYVVIGPSTALSFKGIYQNYFYADSGKMIIKAVPAGWKQVFTKYDRAFVFKIN